MRACLTVIIIGVAAGPSLALAGEGEVRPYCEKAIELRRSVVDCSTNDLALAAADRCLAGIDAEIRQEEARLAAELAKPVEPDAGQRDQLVGHQANLELGLASLQAMIRKAEAVRNEVSLYQDVISFPGGVSREEAAAIGETEMLSSFDCFQDKETAIREDLAVMDRKIAELKGTAATTAAMSGRTAGAVSRLDVAPSVAPGRRLSSLAAGEPGSGPGRQSQVTGSTSPGGAEETEAPAVDPPPAALRFPPSSRLAAVDEATVHQTGEMAPRPVAARERNAPLAGQEWSMIKALLATAEEGQRSSAAAVSAGESASLPSSAGPTLPPGTAGFTPSLGVVGLTQPSAERGNLGDASESSDLFRRTHDAYERQAAKKAI